MIGRTTSSPSSTTTCSRAWPTARIAACGGVSTATNWSIPNKPRVESVEKAPPGCAALEVGRLQLAVARTADEVSARRSDLGDREALHRLHDRDDQPGRRRDGES